MAFRQIRRLSNISLFGDAIREQFVGRVQQQHTHWSPAIPTARKVTPQNSTRSCAVLIPLINIRSEPCLLFTQRALVLKNYRGEVCFPGGKLETNEDPEKGALRESYEEIGLDIEKVDIWGKLPPVYNQDLKCDVTPVVGMLKDIDLKTLKAQGSEVRTVFVVTVRELCTNKSYIKFKNGDDECTSPVFTSRQYEVIKANGEAPAEYRIWGLSAGTLQNVLSLLFPEACNSDDEKVEHAHY